MSRYAVMGWRAAGRGSSQQLRPKPVSGPRQRGGRARAPSSTIDVPAHKPDQGGGEPVPMRRLEDQLDDYLVSVADDQEVRQGDLIHRFAESRPEGEWGFVLTADCDIAQGKTGDRYTFIEVVPAGTYLEEVWAPTQLKRFVGKQAKAAAEQLNGVMKRSGLELGITVEVLLTWLAERTPAEIEKALNKTGKPLDRKLVAWLTALRVASSGGEEATAMQRFRAVRALMGDDAERIRRAVREAFEGAHGFPDFFLLPELPSAPGYGFVVMLRAIRSLNADDLFATAVDARIAGRPDAFHRVGRMSDGVRFAVTQKLTFLFSRIGLASYYEEACQSAVELLSEAMVPNGEAP